MVPTRKPAANRTRRLLLHEESPIVAAVRTNELVKCGTARQPQNRMCGTPPPMRSEEHTSELQSLMRISYAVFCLKKTKTNNQEKTTKKLIPSTTTFITLLNTNHYR